MQNVNAICTDSSARIIMHGFRNILLRIRLLMTDDKRLNNFDAEREKKNSSYNFSSSKSSKLYPIHYFHRKLGLSFPSFEYIHSICRNFNDLSGLDKLLSVKDILPPSIIRFLPALRSHLKYYTILYYTIIHIIVYYTIIHAFY